MPVQFTGFTLLKFKAGVVDYPFGALKDWKNDRRRVAAHRCGSRWKCCIFSLACLSIDAPQLMSSSPSFVGLDLSFFLYLLYSCLKKVKRLPFYLASTGGSGIGHNHIFESYFA
ncbi:hypothetical protein LINGRAHAP2_LOCUS10778 [Linum grandiflorum]